MSLIQMSVSGAVMILVITAVRAISINRLPKKTFAVLWGLVLVRLLVPFSLPSPFSVYSLAGHSGAGQIGTSPIANVLPVDPVSAGTAAAHNTAVSARDFRVGLDLGDRAGTVHPVFYRCLHQMPP